MAWTKTRITLPLDLGALGQDVDVTFEVNYSAGSPGCHTMSNGDPGYPPDPPELEVLRATVEVRSGYTKPKTEVVDIGGLVLNLDEAFYEPLYDRLIEKVEEEIAEGRYLEEA